MEHNFQVRTQSSFVKSIVYLYNIANNYMITFLPIRCNEYKLQWRSMKLLFRYYSLSDYTLLI